MAHDYDRATTVSPAASAATDAYSMLKGQVRLHPAAPITALCGLIVVLALVVASWVIQVPLQVRGTGILMPSSGVSRVNAAISGTVTALPIRENVAVSPGDELLQISAVPAMAGGIALHQKQLDSLRSERELLNARVVANRQATNRAIASHDARLQTLQYEIDALQRQLPLRTEIVDIATHRADAYAVLHGAGAMSAEARAEAKQSALSEVLSLDSIEQQLVQLEGERQLRVNERQALLDDAQIRAIDSRIESERLARQIAIHRQQTVQQITSPIDGVVSHVRVKIGDSVVPGQPLLVLQAQVPELEALLYIPSRAAAGIQVGQAVDVSIDAYPKNLYGTVPARVSRVSRLALRPAELAIPLTIREPVFEIRARLDSRVLRALLGNLEYASGLSLRASVVKKRTRLYWWLLRRGWDAGAAS